MRSAGSTFVLCLGLAGVGSAFAVPSRTDVGPAIQNAGDKWAVWFGAAPVPATRTWEPNAPGDGVRVVDRATATLPSGKQVPLTVSRGVSNAAIKAGLKTLVKGLIPGLTVAEAIWDMLKDKNIERDPSGSPVIDPGIGMEPVGGLMHDYETGLAEAPTTIAGRLAARVCNGQTGGGPPPYECAVEYSRGSCASGWCTWEVRAVVTQGGNFRWYLGGNDAGPEIVDTRCKDGPVARVSLPSQPCKSDRRLPPPDDWLDGLVTEVPPNDLPGFAKDVAKGLPNGFPSAQDIPEVNGPPYVDESPQTTTKPDGSVETRTKRWELEYPGDGTVRYTPKVIEVAPNGDTTITEGGSPEGDNRTDCDKYPDSIGCAKFGEPDGGQVNKKTSIVDFDRVNLSGGSCPADRSFQAFGQSYSISWTPICNATVDFVRPTVLLIFGGIAVFVFIGGLKS